ncbi:DnaB-like helicase C-terminal domain-containing protein [Methyloversatilis sp.]|uniref:DnaB-like helicase C-terminal domain-containing protein n=1 Tax=Methyloversatilis sp. TaxID=2569862 RepID=UPI0035AE34E5
MTSTAATVELPPSEYEGPATEKSVRYTYDETFQGKITALCMRDTTFMQRTEGLIKPEYFEDFADGHLVSIANRYYAKFKKSPGDGTTWKHLITADAAAKIIRPELLVPVVNRAKVLMGADISDRDFVIEEVATFARHQAVSKAILDSVEHLDLRDFEKISVGLKKALDVGASSEVNAYDYGAEIETRTNERIDRAAGKLAPTGITTGYPEIDRVLYHKGWGRKELSVLMGGAKAGKTTALIDFGISACGSIRRHNVAYFTLEVSKEIIGQRLDARVSNHLVMDLDNHLHDVKSRVNDFMSRAGKFAIYEFPTGTMRVSDIRRVLERDKSRGILYDLVIVDYADLMQPERMTDNSIENSKGVYVQLRGLAMQENIAILTATQTNREGAKKIVATMTDIAEDFNKVRIADIIISINKTEEERRMGQARLFFAACRNQASGFTIRVEQDIDRMRFVKSVIGEE